MKNTVFSDIFGLSPDDIELELIAQYLEEDKVTTTDTSAPKSITDGNFACKDSLYSILADTNTVLEWNASGTDQLYLDRLIKRIDAKIAQLEQEEQREKSKADSNDSSAYDDTKEVLEWFIKQYHPKPGFSDYYSILYSITYLAKCCFQPENEIAYKTIWAITEYLNSFSSPPLEGKIIRCIIAYLSRSNQSFPFGPVEEIERITTEYYKKVSKKVLSKNDWNDTDKKFILLSVQLIAFCTALLNPSIQREAAFQSSVAKLSLQCSELCYKSNDYGTGVRFSIISLMVHDAADRQNAFNLLGLCAIDDKQYQLAYDAYFSWINRNIVGSIELNDDDLQKLNERLNSDIEKDWRKKATKAVAMMYGNYAYVCGVMYDLLEASAQRDALLNIAKHNIVLAIEADSASSSYYCSAGTIYYDAKEYEKAILYYKKYYKKSDELADKVTALCSLLQLFQEMLDRTSKEDYEAAETEFLHRYQQLANENTGTNIDEITKARDLYVLLSECSLLSKEFKNLKYVLLEIDNEMGGILNALKRTSSTMPRFRLHLEDLKEDKTLSVKFKNYNIDENTESQKREHGSKEIAYYTSLKNLQYLFGETTQENGSTINCLTMMHARYMNDPDEGLVLLQKLQEYLPKAPEVLRNELYDQKFVFLKSFTGLVDQLNMWTMYGSDRETGNDCNGCCVCIAPETFYFASNKQKKQTSTLSLPDDDYHLYSVAYMDGNKVYVEGIENTNIEERYERVKDLLARISKSLVNAPATDIDIITTCIVRMFEKPMFLFKDMSYHLEAESRLIITRDVKDRSEIKKTPQDPPKLFINPLFQVFPEKIILGPKVDNPDFWIPHLQFELSKIREKWPHEIKKPYKPIVRISRINIR